MREATCRECETIFAAKHARHSFCSQACRRAWERVHKPSSGPRPEHRLAPKHERVCLRPECGRAFTTRMSTQRYCSRPCARRGEKERAKARGYERPKIERTCDHCGDGFMAHPEAGKWGNVYCSDGCQAIAKSIRFGWGCLRHGHHSRRACPQCKTERVERRKRKAAARAERQRAPRRWVAGSCLRCGEHFISRWHPLWPSRFCSDRCAARHAHNRHRIRRRALIKEVRVEDISRTKVFERDGWRCGICGESADSSATVPDPLAPTLDHILPLSLGGEHSYANLQCAHYLCNSRKGNRIESQQLQFAA